MAGPVCMYGDCGYKSIGSCEKNILAFLVSGSFVMSSIC